jgi:hypothetical protein
MGQIPIDGELGIYEYLNTLSTHLDVKIALKKYEKARKKACRFGIGQRERRVSAAEKMLAELFSLLEKSYPERNLSKDIVQQVQTLFSPDKKLESYEVTALLRHLRQEILMEDSPKLVKPGIVITADTSNYGRRFFPQPDTFYLDHLKPWVNVSPEALQENLEWMVGKLTFMQDRTEWVRLTTVLLQFMHSAITHPNTSAETLYWVCLQPFPSLAVLGSQQSKCPEEGRIIAALYGISTH